MTGQLYIVATPIGNLGDITLRALETLKSADVIACEDTRVSLKLLNHYGIKKPLISYHGYNEEAAARKIISEVKSGKSVALITDAGTPLISDPGYTLIRLAAAEGVAVVPIPGASSVIAALSVCGLPVQPFAFLGFPPVKKGARSEFFASYAGFKGALVFLESPNRLPDSLHSALEILGEREAAVCRELTKKFEEVRRAPLSELCEYYEENPDVKGEIVLVIGPPAEEKASDVDIEKIVAANFSRYKSVRDLADSLAELTGLPRKMIYQYATKYKDENEE